MLFSPTRKPKLNIMKYMLLSNSIQFSEPDYYIHIIFNYDTYVGIIQPKQYINLKQLGIFVAILYKF